MQATSTAKMMECTLFSRCLFDLNCSLALTFGKDASVPRIEQGLSDNIVQQIHCRFLPPSNPVIRSRREDLQQPSGAWGLEDSRCGIKAVFGELIFHRTVGDTD